HTPGIRKPLALVALTAWVVHNCPQDDYGADSGPSEVEGVRHRLGEPGALSIVAGHGAVDTLSPDAHDPTLISTPELRELLEAGTISYVALGDRHSTTEVAPGIAYSGAPEVTDFIETDPGNVLVVDLADGRATTTAHHVGTWSFRDLRFEVDDGEDVAAMDHALAEMPEKSRTVLRLTLRGTLTLAEHAR